MDFVYVFGLMFLVIYGAAVLVLPVFSLMFGAADKKTRHKNDNVQRNNKR